MSQPCAPQDPSGERERPDVVAGPVCAAHESSGSRMIGHVMQCPRPRPRPSSVCGDALAVESRHDLGRAVEAAETWAVPTGGTECRNVALSQVGGAVGRVRAVRVGPAVDGVRGVAVRFGTVRPGFVRLSSSG